ncbi:hypothetical protein Tco_1036519, partial [Tanacetum coccineum]
MFIKSKGVFGLSLFDLLKSNAVCDFFLDSLIVIIDKVLSRFEIIIENLPPQNDDQNIPEEEPILGQAPAAPVGFGQLWVGGQIPNNNNGWLEEDPEEDPEEEEDDEEDPEEDLEEGDDEEEEMEVDDEEDPKEDPEEGDD